MKKSPNTLPGFRLIAEDLPPKPVLFEVTDENKDALRSLIANLQGESSRGRRGRRGERGPIPNHDTTQFDGGYVIRFQLPGGGWGEPVEVLQGPPGIPGPSVVGGKGELGGQGEQGRQGESVIGEQGKPGEQGEVGPMPRHEWDGTRLRFELPGGSFGRFVNLLGPAGKGGGGGRSANQGFDSILLNGTDLVFSRAGAGPLGQTITVDLSALGGGGTGDETLTYFLGE